VSAQKQKKITLKSLDFVICKYHVACLRTARAFADAATFWSKYRDAIGGILVIDRLILIDFGKLKFGLD
jgi:hypothetical protein